MATQYHVYSGDHNGGPVDYSTVVATVPGLSWQTPALPTPSVTWFAVRAFDSSSNLEERNVDAVVRIAIDSTGRDVSATPVPPTPMGALPMAGGTARVDWAWLSPPGTSATFSVYATAGSSVDTTKPPAATLASTRGVTRYSATISGLADGHAYAVAVKATNAAGTDPGTATVSVVGSATAPKPVDNMTATAVS